jgi:hypothetical protein
MSMTLILILVEGTSWWNTVQCRRQANLRCGQRTSKWAEQTPIRIHEQQPKLLESIITSKRWKPELPIFCLRLLQEICNHCSRKRSWSGYRRGIHSHSDFRRYRCFFSCQ